MNSIRLAITAICLAFSPLPAESNPAWPPIVPYGTIKGFVRDSHRNHPLPYANVIVAGTTRGTMTQQDGSFAILLVPPGTYEVKTMMMAFHTVSHTGVVVRVGEDTELPITLEAKWSPANDRERSIVGTETGVTNADVRCEIIPVGDRFRVGDAPTFRVVMSNLSDESFYLVHALEGSFEGIRYPTISMAIEGPGRKAGKGPTVCGNVKQIQPDDFTLIRAKGGFEPFDVYVSSDVFSEAGDYKVTFKYSTNGIDYKFWTDRLGPETIHPRALELLRSVPRLEIEESIVVQVVD